MTDEAMSPLRRRVIEDMTIRKLASKTQQGYIRAIKNFAAFLRRSPDTATFEDVRRFQLHLVESGVDTPHSQSHDVGVTVLFPGDPQATDDRRGPARRRGDLTQSLRHR